MSQHKGTKDPKRIKIEHNHHKDLLERIWIHDNDNPTWLERKAKKEGR